MKPRMDDERIKEVLVAIHNVQSRLPGCPLTFEHANPSEIAYIAEFLPDALHDLQDARKRVVEYESVVEKMMTYMGILSVKLTTKEAKDAYDVLCEIVDFLPQPFGNKGPDEFEAWYANRQILGEKP